MKDSDLKIVGGHNSSISEHPWQISLQLFGNHFCGGVLISKQWILTAAHCVDNTIYQTLTSVRIGSTYVDSGGEIIKVSEVIVHPGWNFQQTQQYDNDIALVKLVSSISVCSAEPIPLPPANIEIPDGADIVISGWGATEEDGTNVPSLLEVTVPYIPSAQCNQLYSKTPHHISQNMFCAGFVGIGKKDACQGDSGGPAVYNNKILVGIVSWGLGCGLAQYPGVYVRVTEYLSWINTSMTSDT